MASVCNTWKRANKWSQQDGVSLVGANAHYKEELVAYVQQKSQYCIYLSIYLSNIYTLYSQDKKLNNEKWIQKVINTTAKQKLSHDSLSWVSAMVNREKKISKNI